MLCRHLFRLKASQIFTTGHLFRCNYDIEPSGKFFYFLLNFARGRNRHYEIIQSLSCQWLVGFFPSSKADFNLHLISLREKFFGLFSANIQIVVIRFEAEADSFYFRFLLLGPLLLFFLGFLVLKLSKVHDFHNRRADTGNYFNQIQFSFPGHLKSLLRWNNSNLLAFFINQPDRRDADVFIDSSPRSAKLRLAAKKSSADMFCSNSYFLFLATKYESYTNIQIRILVLDS